MGSALSTITISVTVDTAGSVFRASALSETASGTNLTDALLAIALRLNHLHASLADVPDDDLSTQGQSIRDTPMSF